MTEPEHDSLSRRSLVKTAAAAAAVGGAMMIAGPAAAAETATDADADESSASAAPASHETATGDVVVHVRNAATGELDVYTPDGHHDVTDPALAARLIRLAR